jgi:hypothetical protein
MGEKPSPGRTIGHKLTDITTFIVDLQPPISMWSLSPGVHGHERPLCETGTGNVVDAVRGKTGTN